MTFMTSITPPPEELQLDLGDRTPLMQDQLYLMLGRLEGKVDAVLNNIPRLEDKLTSLDGRINKLEDDAATAAGKTIGLITAGRLAWAAAAATGTFTVTYVIPYLTKVFAHG